jgi:hypothetical protein
MRKIGEQIIYNIKVTEENDEKSQGIRASGPDLNHGPLNYEAGVVHLPAK